MRKLKLLLPIILIPILILPYYFLDTKYFVNIFGCGCNEGFNANDLRKVIFLLFAIFAITISVVMSIKFTNKLISVIYIISVIILNIFYWNYVSITFMWK